MAKKYITGEGQSTLGFKVVESVKTDVEFVDSDETFTCTPPAPILAPAGSALLQMHWLLENFLMGILLRYPFHDVWNP